MVKGKIKARRSDWEAEEPPKSVLHPRGRELANLSQMLAAVDWRCINECLGDTRSSSRPSLAVQLAKQI